VLEGRIDIVHPFGGRRQRAPMPPTGRAGSSDLSHENHAKTSIKREEETR
jgi:hypothetical protein